MTKLDVVEAEISFRPEPDGSDWTPRHLNGTLASSYRPHIVIGDPSRTGPTVGPHGLFGADYIAVAFLEGPADYAVGQRVVVRFVLMFPEADSSAVVPGATFTVHEGPFVVGQGQVIRRWAEEFELGRA
jgi:hypothetical protein